MSTEFNHDGSITVIGYSLPEFCFELCDLAAKGFIVTQENDKAVFGGMGSIYQCTVVPRHGYHIDKDGNHVNVPDTSQETALKDDSSDVNGVGGTDVSETTDTVKTAVKLTPTKKTT